MVKTAYDDGGLSGATMNRPSLQRLLSDIREGKIDVVVVYKVDRLTRSLADFAKMVEILDAHNVSFVAVTQQFTGGAHVGTPCLLSPQPIDGLGDKGRANFSPQAVKRFQA